MLCRAIISALTVGLLFLSSPAEAAVHRRSNPNPSHKSHGSTSTSQLELLRRKINVLEFEVEQAIAQAEIDRFSVVDASAFVDSAEEVEEAEEFEGLLSAVSAVDIKGIQVTGVKLNLAPAILAGIALGTRSSVPATFTLTNTNSKPVSLVKVGANVYTGAAITPSALLGALSIDFTAAGTKTPLTIAPGATVSTSEFEVSLGKKPSPATINFFKAALAAGSAVVSFDGTGDVIVGGVKSTEQFQVLGQSIPLK